MIDAVILAALWEEYNALTPAASRSNFGYWRFAADAFTNAPADDDSECEWRHSLIEKHARAILAHNPDITQDDELTDLYFSNWDFEA